MTRKCRKSQSVKCFVSQKLTKIKHNTGAKVLSGHGQVSHTAHSGVPDLVLLMNLFLLVLTGIDSFVSVDLHLVHGPVTN